MYIIPRTHTCPSCFYETKYSESEQRGLMANEGKPVCPQCLIKFISKNVALMELGEIAPECKPIDEMTALLDLDCGSEATPAEVRAGTDTDRIITPARITRSGLIGLAAKADIDEQMGNND